ncbi:hypothetical protein FBU30_007349, partial [Linnemannia zychae]
MFESNGHPDSHYPSHYAQPYPSPPFTAEENEFARKEILLRQDGLLAEMQLVTQKRISLQRTPSISNDSSTPGALGTTLPSLFVILPTINTTPSDHFNSSNHFYNNNYRINNTKLDFRLHFVCHYGEILEEGQDSTLPPSPRLHICEEEEGYALQNISGFCEEYKISLLSLLHAAHVSCTPEHIQKIYRDENDSYSLHRHRLWPEGDANDIAAAVADIASRVLASNLPNPPLPTPRSILDRIEIAILYLLRYHFTEQELQDISLTNAPDDYDAGSLTRFQLSDIADSDKENVRKTMAADGRILGPLRQDNRSTVSANDPMAMDVDRAMASTTTTPPGLIQWLCPKHVGCKTKTWDTLRHLCHPDPNETTTSCEDCCIEPDRAIEVSFKKREHAQNFYSVLRSAKCVVKLRIHLEWEDLSNQDLREFATAVWEANVSDVTLDCCCCPEGEPNASSDCHGAARNMTKTTAGRSSFGAASAAASGTTSSSRRQNQQRPLVSTSSSNLSFAPLLGILYSPFLVSFTLENFAGRFPTLNDSNFDVEDVQQYTFATYQEALFDANHQLRTDVRLRLPSKNSLLVLVFSRCSQTAYARELKSLLYHSPHLTELQIECDNIDSVLPEVADATRQFRQILFLKLSESSWESVEIVFPTRSNSDMELDEDINTDNDETNGLDLQEGQRLTGGGHSSSSSTRLTFNEVQLRLYNSYKKWQHISGLNRKTRRPPCPILQTCGVIENLTTYCYLRLWEEHQESFEQLLKHNLSLQGLELMCETSSIPNLWNFLTTQYNRIHSRFHPQERPFFRLRLNDEDCSLMAITSSINVFVLHSYSTIYVEPLKNLLGSLGDITRALCIGSNFQDADQMEILCKHLKEDGLKFSNLTWVIGRRIPSDDFLRHLKQIVTRAIQRRELERFTIRVYVPLLKVSELIRLWNAVVEEVQLNETEHGTWIRRCLGLEPGSSPGLFSSPQYESGMRPTALSSALMMTPEEMMTTSIKEIRERAFDQNQGPSPYSYSTLTNTSSLQRQRPSQGDTSMMTPGSGPTVASGMGLVRSDGKPSNIMILDDEHTLVLTSSQYFYSTLSSSSSSAANHPHSAETHSLILMKSHQSIP